MEDIKKDIQDANSNYLVSTHAPDKNLLDKADDTINFIKKFLHPHHSYSESLTTQYYLTPDIRAEACATTTATSTESAPNVGSPTIPLSNSTEEPSTFLSTNPPNKPREYPTSFPNSTPSDSPRVEPYHLP